MTVLLHRFGSSLALRIVLPLALALVVVFGGAAVFLGTSVRSEGLRELTDRAQLVASTLAYNAELPMLARDGLALEALLAGAGRDPDIFEVSVLDERGRKLASFSPPENAPKRGTTGTTVLVIESGVVTSAAGAGDQEGSTFALDVPAGSGPGKEIGRVRLMVSTARTDHRTQKLQVQIAAAGLGLLVVCLGIGLTIVRILGRPLRELLEATRRVAAGDLATRVRATSTDEIGELTRAFNRMTDDLETARAEVLGERRELERRVATRTAELERAQETLIHSEKMSAVGQLVAGVAHELNNPLTVVLGYAGILRAREEDADKCRKLDNLVIAAESSKKIVQNLLIFARKQKIEKAPMDANEVVTRTVELRRYHLRSEKIQLLTDLDPRLPKAWADFHQLQQVVLNLLVNAEQAIEDSGVGSFVRFVTRSEGGFVEIAVEDDGPGMPSEVRSRVFEPFFTTKEAGRGTGLGLSICYGIVAEHGGSIRVESEPGKGTRFRLFLPILDRDRPGATEVTDSQPASTAAADGSGPIRVLVIDDDQSVLDFVADAFEGMPVVIEKALGGKAAISRFSEGKSYDVILTDMRMPEVDGRALFRYVQESRQELENRVLFATGDVASLETLSFLESSGRPVLEKPFNIEALRRSVLVLAGETREDI